jgi:hypothetical protein
MSNEFDSEKQAGYVWFKFFFNDWLTDPVVMSMTAAEEGIFIRLLATQALHDFLPADFAVIARMTSKSSDPRTVVRFLQKFAETSELFPIIPEVSSKSPKRANRKLLNLQIKSGKIKGLVATEEKEKREERDLDADVRSGVGSDVDCELAKQRFGTEEL